MNAPWAGHRLFLRESFSFVLQRHRFAPVVAQHGLANHWSALAARRKEEAGRTSLPEVCSVIFLTTLSWPPIRNASRSSLILRLAIISSAQKMARFALCLGLKRDRGLGQELFCGAQRFSLGEDLGTCGVLI